MKLLIIAVNKSHFERICHLYQIPRDQVIYIFRPDQLRGIPPESIVIFGDEWWRGKDQRVIEEFEILINMHNERRKKDASGDGSRVQQGS